MPRQPLRLTGAALILPVLVPLDTAHDGPRFFWQLAPDLRLPSAWALLAPPCCGALILAAALACRRAASLALVTLAAVAGLFLVTAAGAEALAWDLLPSPDAWRCAPGAGLLAVALTAVGVCQPSRTRRVLLAAASPFAAAHLFASWSGEPRLRVIGRVLAHVAASSGGGNLAAAGLLALVSLWPGLAPVVGSVQGRWPPPRSPAATLAAYGAPAVLLPLVERSFADWEGAPGAAATLGSVAMLAAVLIALTSAIALLADLAVAPGRAELGIGLAELVAAALMGLGTARFARPADPDTSFRLGPSTEEGDRLFGTLVPRWDDARASLDLHGTGAGEVAGAEGALLSAARGTGGEVERALAALVSAAAGPDRMERMWYARVERLNETLRLAGLPYYVDPTGAVGGDGDLPVRWFRLDTFRIESVRRFAADGKELATLHVQSLTPARASHGSLGLSRDVQPFAVVALDEIQAYQEELSQLAADTPPRCGSAPPDTVALRACGELLAGLTREGVLGRALVDLTDRHELQHRLDGPVLPCSGWLARRLALRPAEMRDRITRELSAYLAQMSAPGAAPRLGLVRLLRMALVLRRGVEHETALLALEAMGLPEGGVGEAAGDRDEELRARGERAWGEVFGGTLARVVAR